MRLGIVSALAVNDSLSFNDLKKLLKTTDGQSERPRAEASKRRATSPAPSISRGGCRSTGTGWRRPAGVALERYLDHMEAIIHATRQG